MRLGGESARRRVHGFRIEMGHRGSGRRRLVLQRALRGFVDLLIDFVRVISCNMRRSITPLVDEELRKTEHRVALGLGVPLSLGLIEPLVVRERMGIEPHHMRMHQRRPVPAAAPLRRRFHGAIGRNEIGPVHLLPKKSRKALHQFRDVATSGLAFDGHRDCVAIIFNEKQQGQAVEAGGVERLPEFAFASGAIAAGH